MRYILWNGILATFAGILLNFTPCVLPVMPFKIQAILREVGGSLSSRIIAAVSLLLGSLLLFLFLGIGMAYMGLSWGAAFQSKSFLVGLSLFLFVSSVASFLDWTPRLPQFFYRMPLHRYSGAFLTGVLAGVLSTPCTGPFLGSVLAYSVTQDPSVILLMFCSIGFGLSLPYVLILLRPSLIVRLSVMRPIAAQVKPILGFVVLGGAVFFARVLLPVEWRLTLWMSFGGLVFVWALFMIRASVLWSESVLPLLCASFIVFSALYLSQNTPASHLVWRLYSSQDDLNEVMRERRPVLLEFTADWCLNCKVLEKTTYADPEVIRTIREQGVSTFRVDMTEYDEHKQTLLKKYGGNAIPHAVLLNGNGVQTHSFSGLFSSTTLINAITQLSALPHGSSSPICMTPRNIRKSERCFKCRTG